MGGALASNYAANNPAKVKALILNVPFVGSQTIGLANFTSIPVLWDFYLRFFIINKLVQRGDGLTEDKQDPQHFIKQFDVIGTQNAFSSLMKNFIKHDFYNDYQLINDNKIPLHITYATDDEDVPIDSILKAIDLAPDAKTFSFNGGHNIINSRTKEIVSLINDFKESLNN
jgi:pimeloyl-ACP methyl ester carboxylesterase